MVIGLAIILCLTTLLGIDIVCCNSKAKQVGECKAFLASESEHTMTVCTSHPNLPTTCTLEQRRLEAVQPRCVAPARQPLLIKSEPTYTCRLHARMNCSRSLRVAFVLPMFLLRRAHVAHARTWTPFPPGNEERGNSHLRMIIGAASTTCDSHRGRKQA